MKTVQGALRVPIPFHYGQSQYGAPALQGVFYLEHHLGQGSTVVGRELPQGMFTVRGVGECVYSTTHPTM